MNNGIQVKGLKETISAFKRLGVEVKDLKDAFKRIGNLVVSEAQSKAPKKSGALAGSIKASNTQNKSVVRAGSAKVPYAGVQEWGWPRHNIEATHYLNKAVESKQGEVLTALEDELQNLVRRLDLN